MPCDLINEEAGQDIGQGLGTFIDVDCKASKSNQARFLRVCVEIPLDKPLWRGGPVVSPEGDEVRVAFRYKRLVGWCFTCGRIGHELKECRKVSTHDTEDRPYGEWMKAGFRGRAETSRTDQQSPRRQGKPNVQTDIAPMIARPKRSMNTEKEMVKFQEIGMESPTIAQQHLFHKDSIISSPSALLPDSIIMVGLVIEPSKPINVEAENQGNEPQWHHQIDSDFQIQV